MTVDPQDPIVRLCAAGVEAEQAGHGEAAATLYRRAWDARTNDTQAAIAAHYLARVQDDPSQRRAWNERALHHALKAEASSFLPSLYLNLGHSHEEAGDRAQAAACYAAAATALAAGADAADGEGPASLRSAVDRARARVADV